MPILYTQMSIYCCLAMRVTVASVLSHLVVRPRRFWEIKEKKMKKKINNDLAIVASQYLEGRFMTRLYVEVTVKNPLWAPSSCRCRV